MFATRYVSNNISCTSFYDIAIIGGGIVGLATANRLIQMENPPSVIIVEKEQNVGKHQSSHNSGVMHAGIYYQPGSDRARLCVKGLQQMYSFLDENNLPYKKCGKLIVTTENEEIPLLQNLFNRATKNQCPNIRMITSQKEISEIEPHCRGVAAIHSPETGITNFRDVCMKLKENLERKGVEFRFNYHANHFETKEKETIFENKNNSNEIIRAKYLLSCSGSESDRVAVECGLSRFPAVIPVRGKWSIIKPVCYHHFEMCTYILKEFSEILPKMKNFKLFACGHKFSLTKIYLYDIFNRNLDIW